MVEQAGLGFEEQLVSFGLRGANHASIPVLTGGIALREMQGMHQALVLLAVSCSAYQGGDQADRWPAPTQTKRIKVQHLSPFVGRHNGGLLVNVTGKGVPSARPLSLV